MNEALLRRAAQSARRPPRPVPERDVAGLAAELGRPLPAALVLLWSCYGEGTLGGAHLAGPREISAGLAMDERWLDEALLTVGLSPSGGRLLLRLDDGDDPLLCEADGPRRTELGTLGEAVERWATSTPP